MIERENKRRKEEKKKGRKIMARPIIVVALIVYRLMFKRSMKMKYRLKTKERNGRVNNVLIRYRLVARKHY